MRRTLLLAVAILSSIAGTASAAVYYNDYGYGYRYSEYYMGIPSYGYRGQSQSSQYSCLYRNGKGECMIEQYNDPYARSYNYYDSSYYYNRDDLYRECLRNSRNGRYSSYDCEYYDDDWYDYDYLESDEDDFYEDDDFFDYNFDDDDDSSDEDDSDDDDDSSDEDDDSFDDDDND